MPQQPRLRTIDGIGPVLAARLIGRTGRATRFAAAAAYATYNGTAPIEIASADRRVHRLSRYDGWQLPRREARGMTTPQTAKAKAAAVIVPGNHHPDGTLIDDLVTAENVILTESVQRQVTKSTAVEVLEPRPAAR